MNNWLNVYVNCSLNQWFCYWILKSCCCFEVGNNFIASGWQNAPRECPAGFKPTSISCSLLSSWLLHFFPGSSSTTHSWHQRVSNGGLIRLPGKLVEMHTPSPLVLTWQTWDSVLLISISEAGLGVSFWKELAEVEMPYEVPGSRLWEQRFPLSGFQPSASLLVDLSPAQLV